MYEGKEFEIDVCDLIIIRNFGRGVYGIVDLVRYRISGVVFVVKVIFEIGVKLRIFEFNLYKL